MRGSLQFVALLFSLSLMRLSLRLLYFIHSDQLTFCLSFDLAIQVVEVEGDVDYDSAAAVDGDKVANGLELGGHRGEGGVVDSLGDGFANAVSLLAVVNHPTVQRSYHSIC